MFLYLTFFVLSILALILLFYGTITCPFLMELDERELFFENLPLELDGKTIFFCGDLHLRQWDYRILWVQHKILETKADLILFSGDIVEESGISLLQDFLTPLSAPLGMCFVPGNNENGLKEKSEVFSMFENVGFEVLLNSSFRICPGAVVAGTDDPSRNHDDLAGALENIQESDGTLSGNVLDEDFVIALTHSPELFPHCIEKKIPLTLCGHTHGGQVRLPYIGAVWIDTPRTKGKYDAGIFDEEGCKLIVTRGVGMSKLPVRCLCNPEVHLFTLRKAIS